MLEVEKRWQKILASVLEGATVEAGPRDSGVDLVVRTRDGRAIAIEVKWAGEGWPQDVRRVAATVGEQWPENTVLLARSLSPGAIEWLRERGANWADEAGRARIIGPDGLLVIRELAQPPDKGSVPRPFSWSKSAIAVAEAILAHEDRPLRVAELAEASDWSTAQAAKVLKAFDGQGWTAKHGASRGIGAHRVLVDADELLAAWSAAVADSPRRTRIAHRATKDVMALLRHDLVPALERRAGWAVSGWAGLELAAPFATTTPSLHIYIADTDFAAPLSDAIEEAGLREVDEGGRVTFWAADARIFAFSRQVEDVPVVSAPRLFADLSSFGGRGGDAADHVKAELIDPLHPGESAGEDATDG
jgi:transcriptional regulator with AbiEi antitoxin domain of type IV toxin-antitoxin system